MPTLKNQVLGEMQGVLGKPVMDKDGKVIGRIGEDPKEPEVSAEEKIKQGIKQNAEAARRDIVIALEKCPTKSGTGRKPKITSTGFPSLPGKKPKRSWVPSKRKSPCTEPRSSKN